jgi:3-dehydroquinate synthase
VGQDERESGLRAILNYGHTIGHAVEAAAGYGKYLHGEAIGIGMAAAGWLGVRTGRLDPADAARIERLLTDYGVPVRLDAALDEEAVLSLMRADKKSVAGELRFVLARRIGEVEVAPLDEALVREAVRAISP